MPMPPSINRRSRPPHQQESHDHIPQPGGAELRGTILEVAVGQISWMEHFRFQVDISIRINYYN